MYYHVIFLWLIYPSFDCYNQVQMNHTLHNIHIHPLPPLRPLTPPSQIINFIHTPFPANSLTLSAVPQETIQDDSNLYKELYQQKCQAQNTLQNKCKSQQEIIKILQQKNAALQQQLSRTQQQKWKRFDYSKLSSRGRSKSQRRMVPPTIDVKVPKRMHQHKEILIEQQNFVKTDRDVYNQEIEYYRTQIRECRAENKQLKELISKLQFKKQELPKEPIHSQSQRQSFTRVNKSRPQKSPLRSEQGKYGNHTPVVSQFSPSPLETVKKQGNNSQELQLKQLRNQIMYKDLLLDKLRTDNQRQSRQLKNHLRLSVQQSHKVTQQTTFLLNAFKTQIIRLTHELMDYKRNKSLESQKRENNKEDTYFEGDFLRILRNRRNQQTNL